MARGKSGRIVLEVDHEIKNELYVALAKNETTLKDWFLSNASNYIKANMKSNDLLVAEDTRNTIKYSVK